MIETNPEPAKRIALYRLYDRDGNLLYVGVTNNLRRRWDMHSRDQTWWHLVTRREAEWLPDRASAEAAEITAIQDERPRFNIDHSLNPKWGGNTYDDTADQVRALRLLRRDAKKSYFHVGRTFHITALADRFEVSSRTLLSVIGEFSGPCFAEHRRRLTVLREPTFSNEERRSHRAYPFFRPAHTRFDGQALVLPSKRP